MPDYLPRGEPDLLRWCQNLLANVQRDPPAVGLTQERVDHYAAVLSHFAETFRLARAPKTRTKGHLATKDVAKAELLRETRALVGSARAFPAITETQEIEMGLRPRYRTYTRHGPPTSTPILHPFSNAGRIVEVRLIDSDTPDRRARPKNVDGYVAFSFVGEDPPADLDRWQFRGGHSRLRLRIVLPPSVPLGSTLWLTARWTTRTHKLGPIGPYRRLIVGDGIGMVL